MADKPDEGGDGHPAASNGNQGANVANADHQPEQKSAEKKPSKLKAIWSKLGLDTLTVMLMLKGSIPPTIGIAIYQAKGVQAIYGNSGYLIAISSVLGLCIMPRGKFIQNLGMNIVSICFASAVNMLALYCGVEARLNSSTPPATTSPAPIYNASQSAVIAVWLIFQTYTINALRAARPQLQFPVILYSIITNVSLVYGTVFTTVAEAESFIETLLYTFLTGLGLATAVHFVVFPVSSRKVVMKEWTGYFALLNGCLKTQLAYMANVATVDPAELRQAHLKADEEAFAKSKHHKKPPPQHTAFETPVALKYEEVRTKLIELHTKIEGDVTPAKREMAIGKLESHDLTRIWKLLKMIFLPVLGLGSMIFVLNNQAEGLGWARTDGTEEEKQARHAQIKNLHFLMKELQDPFTAQVANIEKAFQHIMLTLELTKPPKKQKQPDEENSASSTAAPGTPGFAEAYKKDVDEFYASKQRTLRDWCHEHGVELPDDFFQSASFQPQDVLENEEHMRDIYQRQLFFTLYLEYLLWRVSTSVLDLVLYVDERKQAGIFKRSRIIFPGSRTLYKWIQAALGREDLSQEDSYVADWDAAGAQAPYLGIDFGKRKNPEHLPPRNKAEKIGDALRVIPRFFRSEESVHGARVAAATMTIGVICYIRPSQIFFLKERLLWAMIMVAISMTRTAGQSILQFGLRVTGTTVAMIGSYVIYYIVDGHTAGVIVFLWLWIFLAHYVVVKHPQYAIVGILSLVTAILIIGYELQVQAVGVKVAEANGQPAYPTYILAPYRLAVVICGLLVAFIWTVFPFPASESSAIRKDLAASLYLMCSFYSIVGEGVRIRVTGFGGDPRTKGTHAYNLEKARYKVFAKLLMLLSNLRMNAAFSKFQLEIGGRFPRQTYIQLIGTVQRLALWTSLASYSSATFQTTGKDDTERSKWSSDFRQLLIGLNRNSNKVTSLLSLLSSSLTNAQPLPPFLEVAEPFEFVKMIESIDRDILSIQHIAEPEYSAFAVMQIVSQSINKDLAQLVSLTRDLVGEIDFSFHAVDSSTSLLPSSSVESGDDKDKDKVQ